MEEMLEKMSLTTSSGKALLLRASSSSSWKKTCGRHRVTGLRPRGTHPQHRGDEHSPGSGSQRHWACPPPYSPIALTTSPEDTGGEGSLLVTVQTANPGLDIQGLGQRLAADGCWKWARLEFVRALDFVRLKIPLLMFGD